MVRMPLLVDECVRKAVCDVFASRGHEIHYVTQELGQKTPDPLVAASADENKLILVTVNYSHFKALLARGPIHNQQKFRWAGLISFEKCKDSRTDSRAAQTIQSIEFEYEQSLRRRTAAS